MGTVGIRPSYNLVDLYLEEDNNMQNMKPFEAVKRRKDLSTTHNYTSGKSRVMGAHGVGQGNKGWQSQAGGDYGKQINPIINSLSNAPTYTAPKITDPLTSNKGFNQALGAVGARNNAKLHSQNQRVLQGVLGSLVSGDSQNRATKNRFKIAGMQDDTDMRGQDFSATAKAEALAETKVRDTNQNNYYEGMNSVGEERNNIARYKAENPTTKQMNPIDEQIKRKQLLIGKSGVDSPSNVFGSEYDMLDKDTQASVNERFINTGERPTGYTQTGGSDGFWDSREYSPVYGKSPQGEQAPTQQQGQGGGEQPKFSLDANQTSALATAVAKGYGVAVTDINTDTNGNFVLPNGDTIPMETAWGRMNGKH